MCKIPKFQIIQLLKSTSPKITMLKLKDTLPPLESSAFIAHNSDHVKVKKEGISQLANVIYEGVQKNEFGMGEWKEQTLHPNGADNAAIEWIFVVDTLNFCFWSYDVNDRFQVTLDGQVYTGYWSLCAVINKALRDGVSITDASYYATINEDTLCKIFRGDSSCQIPLLGERLRVLKEAGKVLNEKFDGKFVNCVKQCNGSAAKLMELVFEHFPSYRDVALYKGKNVSLLKRLQILVADIWMAFEGQGLGEFTDIDNITAFADYRIPQVLLYYGALSYSDELLDTLKKDKLLESGCTEEVEIRGCSLYAIKLITDSVKKILATDPKFQHTACNMILVDNFIWTHRRNCAVAMETVPFHKVRWIYY